MKATVTLSIEPSNPFEIVVNCNNQEESFLNGVKNGIILELLSHIQPVLNVKVTIDEMKEHFVNSSYAAFHSAATMAMKELFGVDSNETNIDAGI